MALSPYPVPTASRDWERMDASPDRVVFQTREWLQFITSTQGAEPVVAAVMDDGRQVGWFTGAVFRRLRILGSPFPGWTTESMGFNLADGVDRRQAAAALIPFAFRTQRCAHVEFNDRRLEAAEDLAALGFASEPTLTFEIDLSDDEDAIFGRMSSACRRAVRRGAKVGVTVEEASGPAPTRSTGPTRRSSGTRSAGLVTGAIRGMTVLDLGGGGEYKRTYGPSEVRVPGFRASRYRALPALRAAARFATVQRQALRGRLPRKT